MTDVYFDTAPSSSLRDAGWWCFHHLGHRQSVEHGERHLENPILVLTGFCLEKTLITSALFLLAKSNHVSMCNLSAWNVLGRREELLMNILND